MAEGVRDAGGDERQVSVFRADPLADEQQLDRPLEDVPQVIDVLVHMRRWTGEVGVDVHLYHAEAVRGDRPGWQDGGYLGPSTSPCRGPRSG